MYALNYLQSPYERAHVPLDTDMVTMFDEAYRKVPNNEELGAQDFFANVRTGNWKSAQQVRSSCSAQSKPGSIFFGSRLPQRCTSHSRWNDTCTGALLAPCCRFELPVTLAVCTL